jgi:uncharacterized repeat protein (TIGR03803 family)
MKPLYAAIVLAAVPQSAPAATVTQAYLFKGNGPHQLQGGGGGLVVGPDGSVYGVSRGQLFNGTVYQLVAKSPNKYTAKALVQFSIENHPDGPLTPTDHLTLDAQGNLYGTAQYGGKYGYGVVYEVSPPAAGSAHWLVRNLASFNCEDVNDGCNVWGGVVFGPDGALYGVTEGGGAANAGTVYRVTPPANGGKTWKKSIIWAFSNTDGNDAQGLAAVDPAGNVFAITNYGGTVGDGTLVELSPPASKSAPWTETILQNLSNSTGYIAPPGLVADANGVVFGITGVGGPGGWGTVFSASATQPFQILHASSGAPDFVASDAPLTVLPDGGLLGNSYYGGSGPCSDGCGVLFELDPPHGKTGAWREKLLYSFTNDPGYFPWSNMVGVPGGFLGTTTSGGLQGDSSYGVVYKLHWGGGT